VNFRNLGATLNKLKHADLHIRHQLVQVKSQMAVFQIRNLTVEDEAANCLAMVLVLATQVILINFLFRLWYELTRRCRVYICLQLVFIPCTATTLSFQPCQIALFDVFAALRWAYDSWRFNGWLLLWLLH